MSRSSLRRAVGFLALVAVVILATLAYRSARHQPGAADRDALPPLAENAFRNSKPGVEFIGIDACARCHPDQAASYRETAHNRALYEVNADDEPPDGEFDDPKLMRQYQVLHQGDELRHRESIRTAAGESLVLAEYPMRYVIGSGRFSRSYLFEREGYLFESPATWYAARPGWGLSPGYENANSGFQRPAEWRCVFCHAGRLDMVEGSPQRLAFHALSIDCERCHGPGAAHQAFREQPGPAEGEDPTIVHPGRLDRARREDVCNQCHFHGAATVELRGRRIDEFRPGGRLADFVVHYGDPSRQESMQVVGHVEQMRLSRCWQADTRFTCTTCHDPHARPERPEEWYRAKCLECHTPSACRLAEDAPKRIEARDNCITCHMPRTPTEIPHFAFTHHRVGIHSEKPSPPAEEAAGELVQISEGPTLSPYDQSRNLGLALLQAADAATNLTAAGAFRHKAEEVLTALGESRPPDPEVDSALARIWWRVDDAKAVQHAEAVMSSKVATPDARATACFVLGTTRYNRDRLTEARPWLEAAVRIRPTADCWMMLSDCRDRAGESGRDAARRAVDMAPERPRYLQRYSDLLVRDGQTPVPAERIQQILEYRQKMDRQR